MTDDVSDIAMYYRNNLDRERSRLERHQLEYDLTWRYLEQYLPVYGSILEIGAATGRYTLELAKRGYQVTAVDMSEELLSECQKSIADHGFDRQVQFVLADARDLGSVTGTEFDVVLLMGPLYHLVEEADRKTALKQACDRLRPGGLLLSSFISRFAIMGDLLKNLPQWIENQEEVQAILHHGMNPTNLRRGDFRGYFVKIPEIIPLHEGAGLEMLTLAGVEPAISADDESYNSLEGKQRQLWLDLFYKISTEPSILGASRHLLYIGRKK